MENNRFYTLETENKSNFYQIPKAFTNENSKYFNISLTAKFIYGVLRDRNSLSMKNGLVDKFKRVYFLFNQKKLCKILGIKDTKTLRKYLKELENIGLLYRESMGSGLADKLYLLQLEKEKLKEEGVDIVQELTKNVSCEDKEVISKKNLGKNSLGTGEKKPHGVKENFLTNNTNKNNTKLNKNKYLSSSIEDKLEEDNKLSDLDLLMKFCNKNNFKLSRKKAKTILVPYNLTKVIKAVTTIVNTVNLDNIKNYSAYLVATLKDMDTVKNFTIEYKKNEKVHTNLSNFSNFTERNYDYDKLEKELLGWG